MNDSPVFLAGLAETAPWTPLVLRSRSHNSNSSATYMYIVHTLQEKLLQLKRLEHHLVMDIHTIHV